MAQACSLAGSMVQWFNGSMTRTRLLIGQHLFKEDKTELQSRGGNDNDKRMQCLYPL
jgi:hypothetical protein